ncbi:hypothetical protein ABH926_003075 [Catenulispora sp. GP43]
MATDDPELGVRGLHAGHLAFAQTRGTAGTGVKIFPVETMPIELLEIRYGHQHANKVR